MPTKLLTLLFRNYPTRPNTILMLTACALLVTPLHAQLDTFRLDGDVTTAQGVPIPGVVITASTIVSSGADATGHFSVMLPRGVTHITAKAVQFSSLQVDLDIESDRTLHLQLLRNETVTVHGESDVLSPDPSATAYRPEDLLAANPGRPGVPFSVPGFPTETASGGIKAPQYFAPGVAGDHGEPIAQFFQVGGFLFQNNLTANAHGNGYSDPNIIIPGVIGGVSVDNAAFNARYGNHSINLAVNYSVRDHVAPFVIRFCASVTMTASAMLWSTRSARDSVSTTLLEILTRESALWTLPFRMPRIFPAS